MYLITTAIAAGVLGTLVMDVFNHLISRFGLISKIDIEIIGRMAAGWMRGCFRYNHPNEMKMNTHERFIGYVTHYAIGISFAVMFVFGWGILAGEAVSPIWTIVYGIGTTLASYLLVYPSMGFGVFGHKSPEGIRSTISSFWNHFFFGVGMGVAVALVNAL